MLRPVPLRLWFAVLSAGVTGLSGGRAAEDAAEPPSAPTDVRLSPERIALSLTPTPARSVAVTWRTVGKPAAAWVQVAESAAQPPRGDAARRLAARSEAVPIDASRTVWHHSVVIDELAPGRRYAYRVGDGQANWSEWSQLRTAQAEAAPFRFLYFGDPQNDLKEHCARVFRAAQRQAPDAAFYLVAGDLVTATIVDEQWGDLFYAAGWLPREVPGLATPGNHDYGQFLVGGRRQKTASPLFRAHFTQPENGPPGLEETTYFVDYQGVRFVSLNGNERLEDQARWLDSLLADNPHRWTIVFMHQPVYSTGKNRDNPKLRDALVPVYDRHRVDLVLQGHDHSYGRTRPLRAGRPVAPGESGTVYTVSVSGPKFYPVNPAHAALMARIDTGVQLFQVISVAGDRLQYEAWTVTGERFDAFELVKAPAGRLGVTSVPAPLMTEASVRP